MSDIKFGTDGWRAIIADDFTVENLRRVSYATAQWVKKQDGTHMVTVGYDCRFGGKMFAEITAKVLAENGIRVLLSPGFVSTPMMSLATKNLKATCGIIITASHNPSSYNGYKLKGYFGGPAFPSTSDEIEKLLPSKYDKELQSLEHYAEKGLMAYHNFEDDYVHHAEKSFDLDAIRKSGIRVAYDAMFGAGQRAVARLLPEATMFHCEFNPSFNGTNPEPIMKNLKEISGYIHDSGKIDFGFATDGDADRIGLLDSNGNFVDSHHIILMLITYLYKHKNLKGQVVNSFSCTSRIGDLCKIYNIENVVTKIGFKYICEYMTQHEVMIGGEESGGIAVTGHIPERDGAWIALTLLEYMAKSGKKLEELIEEAYSQVGSFAMERYDLHLDETLKQHIVSNCKSNAYTNFGDYKVTGTESVDGFKFHLGQGKWVMIRASGTEPLLRVYAEASDYNEAIRILDATKATVLSAVNA